MVCVSATKSRFELLSGKEGALVIDLDVFPLSDAFKNRCVGFFLCLFYALLLIKQISPPLLTGTSESALFLSLQNQYFAAALCPHINSCSGKLTLLPLMQILSLHLLLTLKPQPVLQSQKQWSQARVSAMSVFAARIEDSRSLAKILLPPQRGKC